MTAPTPPFGRETIESIIPHRPPFLLVDEVLEDVDDDSGHDPAQDDASIVDLSHGSLLVPPLGRLVKGIG